MAARKTICLWLVCGLLLFIAGPVLGQGLSPAQEQEYIDAKLALEAARSAQAEKYSADHLKKAGDFLSEAESARSLKGGVEFTQASRLARVYAELAQARAELRIEEEKLAAVNEDLQKIKAEMERLKKNP